MPASESRARPNVKVDRFGAELAQNDSVVLQVRIDDHRVLGVDDLCEGIEIGLSPRGSGPNEFDR